MYCTSYPTGSDEAGYIADIINHRYAADPFVSHTVGHGHNFHAACSSFTYALTHLKDHEQDYSDETILVVCSEKYSDTLHPLDRNVDPSLAGTLFSDGAVAMSFPYGPNGLDVVGYTNHYQYSEDLCMPINTSLICEPAFTIPIPLPPENSNKFTMKGKEVKEQVAHIVPWTINETLSQTGVHEKEIDLIVPHQGSNTVLKELQKKLPVTLQNKLFFDLRQGNYSSASIPKALMQAIKDKQIKRGSKVLLCGFGAGLFASTVLVQF
jgi:3-oxoacyl-[acyl-carrier-protein] synthase-3